MLTVLSSTKQSDGKYAAPMLIENIPFTMTSDEDPANWDSYKLKDIEKQLRKIADDLYEESKKPKVVRPAGKFLFTTSAACLTSLKETIV